MATISIAKESTSQEIKTLVEALPTESGATSAELTSVQAALTTLINNLQTTANATATSSALSDVKSVVDDIDTNAATATALAAVKTVVDSIKTTVEAAATATALAAVKTVVDTINTTTSAGATASKLAEAKTVIDNIYTAVSSGGSSSSVINSVQYGTVSIANGSSSGTATVTSVDTSKAVLIPLGSVGASGLTSTIYASGYWDTRLALTSSTVVTASRYSSFATGVITVGFCLVEFA